MVMLVRYLLPFWLLVAPLESAIAADLKDPPANGVAVTPSDTVLIPETTALWIGNATAATPCAAITVTMAGNDGSGSGGKVTLSQVLNGLYPLRVTQVWSTGTTTCTSIVAFH
jgi:hypothetical protein